MSMHSKTIQVVECDYDECDASLEVDVYKLSVAEAMDKRGWTFNDEGDSLIDKCSVHSGRYGKCPECGSFLKCGDNWSGVKCTKCSYWYCA